MQEFQHKVDLLVAGMNTIDGVSCADARRHVLRVSVGRGGLQPAGHHSHGLALYLARRRRRHAGRRVPGRRVLRRRGPRVPAVELRAARRAHRRSVAFMAEAFTRKNRVDAYLETHPEHMLKEKYEEPMGGTRMA